MAMIKLVGLEGPLRGKSRMLPEGEYLMGRDGCAISIPDPKVSSVHAKLHITSGHVTIEDVDSLNGTYVNDAKKANRIFFETLNDQDTFALGPNSVFGIRFFEFRSAGFWKRVLAMLIDSLVLSPVLIGGYFLIALLARGLFRADFASVDESLVVFWLLVSLWGGFVCAIYFTVMHGWRGQTLGKMAMSLKVVRSDGRSVPYTTAFLRYLMWSLLSNFSVLIFYVFLAVHPQKRGWHDLIADTRVIEVTRA